MSEFKNVPLSPEEEAWIREIGEGYDDAGERLAAEQNFRRKLQAKANRAAVDRQVFREARERARAGGFDDPEGYASKAVAYARLERSAARKQAANAKRSKAAVRSSADRTAGALEAAAKTARPDIRRSPDRDREYVTLLGSAERSGHRFDSSLVTSKLKKHLGKYAPPHWDKGTIPIKVLAMSLEASKRGAWTINLHPSQEICLKALASPRGPASFLQDRVRKGFKSEFGHTPEFWFTVERDNDTRFHLHGAVTCDISDEDAVRRVDAALRSAGGRWEASRGGPLFQQQGRVLTEPFLWAAYAIKDLSLTAISVDRKLLASTAEIRAAARGTWNFTRDKLPRV